MDDGAGVVRRVWIGRLPENVENEIVRSLAIPSLLNSSRSGDNRGALDYRLDELNSLLKGGEFQVVLPEERADARPQEGEIVMPLLEMPVRATIELSRNKVQVVDCSNIGSGECDKAVGTLSHMGFQVATVGSGALYRSCSVTQVGSR